MGKHTIPLIIFLIDLSDCADSASETTPMAVPPNTTAPLTSTFTPQPTKTAAPPLPTDTLAPKVTATVTLSPTPEIIREQVEIPYEDRVIRGTLVGEGDITVVLAPMFDRSRSSWMDFAKHIASLGYTALAFDFPGYGASSGEFNWTQVTFDVEAVIDFLEERGYENIICMGASLGALGCFEAALLKPNLAGLVIISDPLSTTTSEEAAILLMPKLYIRGDEPDDIILPMEEVYKLLPMPKRFEIIEEKAHGTDMFQSDAGDMFQNLLVQFLEDIR